MLLFQTIFVSLLYSEEKVTMAVLALRGFKYSLGMQIPMNYSLEGDTSSYLLDTVGYNLFSFYVVNFLLYVLPLLALLFLLYKLKYRHFPVKM